MRKEIERANFSRLCCFIFYVTYFFFDFIEETTIFLVFIQTFFESYGSSLFLE